MAVRAGTAFVDVRGDWTSFNRQLTAQGASLKKGFGKLGGQLGTQLSRGATVAAKAGVVGLAGGFTYAVKKAADFEQELSSLGAVSDATGKQMVQFRKQALKAGADTKFSALEAARAQTELAKGGLTVSQIMGGGLKASLALAAAGQLDLADAAEATVNAMKLFGLRGGDSMKVADAFATAANRTTADVSDFALALKMGGSVAKLAGLSFNDTVVALEALAEAGIKGSDAGTSLKSFFLQIATPSVKASKSMKALGVSIFDAQGNLKSLPAISQNLQEAFGDLTREEFLNKAGVIAGSDAIRALYSLYDAGPAKLRALAKETATQGTAAEVAKRKQDNLKGSLEQLGGSVETLGISVGSAMIPSIRRGTDEITKFTNKITGVLNRDDLSLGEKLNRSIAIAKVDAKPWLDKLGQEIEQADLPERFADVLSAATPKIADAAAKAAPVAAGAFAKAWLSSSVWGRLAIGGFLLSKMGGLKTFRALGAQTGTAMGAGMASGVAASGLKGRLSSMFRAWGPGLAVSLVALFGPEFVKQFGQNVDLSSANFQLPKNLDPKLFGVNLDPLGLGKKLAGAGADLRDFGDSAEHAFEQARKAGDSAGLARLAEQARSLSRQFPGAGAELLKFADAADRAARDAAGSFRDVSRLGGKSLRQIKTATQNTAFEIKNSLGYDTAVAKDALAKNFAAAAKAVQKSMDAGVISTKEGTRLIEQYMVEALQNMGFSKKEALNLRRAKKSGSKTTPGANGELRPHQRGGLVQFGQPGDVGPDSIAARVGGADIAVAPGEVAAVFNRHQLPIVNQRLADMGGLPGLFRRVKRPHRFATGGIVALGRRLQREGYEVGENPAFGGVTPGVHAPGGYHPKGLAIDVNDDVPPFAAGAGEPGSLDRLYQRLKGMAGVVELLWRVAGHFDHLHVAMNGDGGGALGGLAPKLKQVAVAGPDSPLKSLVQGALDTVGGAAQSRLDSLAGGSGAEGAEPGATASGNGADLMRQIASKRGWNFADWWALDARETSHGANLANPTSTARLRGQFLDSNWGKYGPGSDPRQNPSMAQQIQSMAAYIAERYGNPTKALEWHKGHNWYQRGGLITQLFQPGGLVGQPFQKRGFEAPAKLAPDLAKALRKVRTGKTAKVRGTAVTKLIDRIKGIGLPSDLQSNLSTFAGNSNTFGEYADRAGQLTDTGAISEALQGELERRQGLGQGFPDADQQQMVDGMLGRVGGKTQMDWLAEQLGSLLKWRNSIIKAEKIVVDKREETTKLIEQARARLKNLNKQIRDEDVRREKLGKRLEHLRDRIKNLRDGKNKGLVARLRHDAGDVREKIIGIDVAQRGRTREQTALKDRILPALTGQRENLVTGRGELLSSLETAQGAGSPMDLLTVLPPVGVLGGTIFDAQLRLKDLTDNPPRVSDSSATSGPSESDSQRADLLTQLLREANQRTAVSEKQFDVFKNFLPPYGGSFKTGGVVPGPTGAARTIIAHGGEEISPVGGEGPRVRVVMEDHRTRVFVDDVEQIVEQVTRRQARAGGRMLPGRSGGGLRG